MTPYCDANGTLHASGAMDSDHYVASATTPHDPSHCTLATALKHARIFVGPVGSREEAHIRILAAEVELLREHVTALAALVARREKQRDELINDLREQDRDERLRDFE